MKRGADSFFAVIVEAPSIPIDNVFMTQGKPLPGPFADILGREELIKNSMLDFFRYSAAIIRNRNLDSVFN
jgi:hypothetical protein